MSKVKRLYTLLFALVFLVACDAGATPTRTPLATIVPTANPTQPPPTATPTAAPTIAPFSQVTINEPLAVINTQPADKAEEFPTAKANARIIVQFNHPVVPLVAVEEQKGLPQPLTLQPALTGETRWINTSTFSFTPSQDLAVATQYKATLAPLRDMLGGSLGDFSWTFRTAAPSVVKLDPSDNTKFVAPSQPITITFNTAMDRVSTESRLTIKRADSGSVVPGRFEWQGSVLKFVPNNPLEYNRSYKGALLAGAQDSNKIAATFKDVNWTFTTADKPGVRSTLPKNAENNARLTDGFKIEFSSPMRQNALKVTIQPTITNQSTWWEGDKSGRTDSSTVAHIGGYWVPSQAFTVTISADSTTRYGEKLPQDVVVRFKTAPRDPEVYLNVPGNIGMYDSNVSQTIVASFVNLNKIDYRLYQVSRSELLSLIGRNFYQAMDKFTPKESSLLRAWSLTPQAPLNATRLISSTLAVEGTSLSPGIYFVQASSPSIASSNKPSRHLLAVTGVNLALKRTETEALVWVTDLKTGQPVPNQPLTLYGSNVKPLASGKSDKDGIWRASFARQNAWESIYVLSEVGSQITAAIGSDWNNGIMSWDFSMPSQQQANDYYANLYTDRPIYRSGQSVFFRGILRRDNDAKYMLPDGLASVPVIVRDAQGKQISSSTALLTRFGTFNGEVKLSEAASIGFYNLGIELGQDPYKFYSSVAFQVAEYRRPEFQVTTQTDKKEYSHGETIKVDVDSSYFFGGPVSDAQVNWRLLTEDYFFYPKDIEGWWDFVDYDLAELRQHQGGVIREGKGKTDSTGKFHFEAPADLKEYPISQNFTLEAEITDINNQVVSSRTVVPVHKSNYYVGLRPQRYVGTVGVEQSVDIVSVDTKGSLVPSLPLAVSFLEHQWFSVKEKRDDGGFYWRSSYTDTLVSKVNVTTDAMGKAVAKFTPSKGGIFKIVAEGQDNRGNQVRSATYQWVSGREFINWRMENNDRIDLVADKKEYAVGDTADILIPAPFKNAEALLTIERGTIREVRRLTLSGNSERIQLPITADFSPNVFVSVFLVKGRGPDSPTPQFKLGYTNLAVKTTEKELKIAVTPDRKVNYSPGDKATFGIQVTDSKGTPVEAELSVAVVDKAIASLADDRAESPLDAFYGQRGLGVQTAASLVRSIERANQTLTPEAKGGGGGLIDKPVRRDFRDTAYWKADVVTDASGQASVSVPLPDNLTTWSLTTKGVTASTMVGEAKSEIMSTKDLLVRPVAPRFLVVGDKVHLEAAVNNNSDRDIGSDVKLEGSGFSMAGNTQQALTVKAHDKGKVGWDITVGSVEQVTLKMSVVGGQLSDAVEQVIPVRRPSAPETVATAGQVDNKTAEQIKLPANVDKNVGSLKIEVSPSLAAASRQSLKYLEGFDYECAEQTISKFFPNVATLLTLKKLGIERPDLQRELEANVSLEIQRLYALQNQDGGWGWWAEDESRPVLTAYALLGLVKVREAGFAVDKDILNRAEQSLTRYLDKPTDVKQLSAANERAFVIYVLTEMGRAMTSRAVNLFDTRSNLGIFGKAFLLMSLHRLKQPQAQTMVSELTSAGLTSASGTYWDEAKQDYYAMNTNTRTTAVVIMALSRADPKNALLANGVRWLMVARKDSHWSTTQETAWSILSLTEYMQLTGELRGSYGYQVSLNNKTVADGQVNSTNVDQSKTISIAVKDLVQTAANDLVLTRTAGEGRLYYSAYLDYFVPAEGIRPLNKGIIVERQYEQLDPLTLKPTGKFVQSAKVGDYVRVILTIVASSDLNYAILEDTLPAGFEAVDTTLKTATSAAQDPRLTEKQDPFDERWFRPYWYYWAHSEIRDDRVAAFSTFLPRGTYEYSYVMRASAAGDFQVLPARVWEMYFPDVFGRSGGLTFRVGQ